MRLLFVVHQFLPRYVTGTEQYVRSLARGLIDRGHVVEILALEPQLGLEGDVQAWLERDEEVDGIPVRRVGIHLPLLCNLQLADYDNPLAVRLLRRYLDARPRFDLVHVFHLRYLGLGALRELEALGLPAVVNLMDFWFVCPNFTLLRRDGSLCDGPPDDGLGCVPCVMEDVGDLFERVDVGAELRASGQAAPPPPDQQQTPVRRARALVGRRERLLAALARADAVVAPSLFLRSVFEDNGYPAGVMRHVPYGVDPSRLGGQHKEWPAEPGPGLAIGYVGSLTEHKGLHVLIPALRAIDGEAWQLHVHGSPDTHPEYTERLLELAADDPRIAFHGAFEPAALGGVLQGIDLLVVPSLWYENTPFSVLEAQMMRLPVLASDLGGISESIDDGVDGFLFPAGDQQALSEVLRRILAAPERLREMELGRRVRTLDENLDDFEALYAELLGGVGAAGATDVDPGPANA